MGSAHTHFLEHTMTPEQRKSAETDGYVVIPGVLNEEECKSMRDGLWDHAEYLLPEVSRSNRACT